MVDQLVPHSGNVLPGNLRVLLAKFYGKLLDCFANDFQLANDAVLMERLLPKCRPVQPGQILLDAADGVQDVLQKRRSSRFIEHLQLGQDTRP